MKRCGRLFSCQFLLETFPVREKMRGGSEGACEGGDLKLISHSYLDTGGCRSSVQPSWCRGNDGPPPLLWAPGSVSEVKVLYHPSAGACSFTPHSKTEEGPLAQLIISADYKYIRLNTNFTRTAATCGSIG